MIHAYPVLLAVGVGGAFWAADRVINDKMGWRKAIKGKATKSEIDDVISILEKAKNEDRFTHKQFTKVVRTIKRINKYER